MDTIEELLPISGKRTSMRLIGPLIPYCSMDWSFDGYLAVVLQQVQSLEYVLIGLRVQCMRISRPMESEVLFVRGFRGQMSVFW